MHEIDIILIWCWRDVSHGSIDKRACRSKYHGSFRIRYLWLETIHWLSCPFVERRHSWRGLQRRSVKSIALIGGSIITWSIWVCCMDKPCFSWWIVNLNHLMNLSSVSWVWSIRRCMMILSILWIRILLKHIETWRSHDRETRLIHEQIVLVSLQVRALKLILNELPLCNLVRPPGPTVWLALNL